MKKTASVLLYHFCDFFFSYFLCVFFVRTKMVDFFFCPPPARKIENLQVLSDPNRRRQYDLSGGDEEAKGADYQPMDMEGIGSMG